MHTALLAPAAIFRVRRGAGAHRRNHFALARDDYHGDIGDHNGAGHRTHLQKRAAAREYLAGNIGDDGQRHGADHAQKRLIFAELGSADQIIGDPTTHQHGSADANALPGGKGHHSGVNQIARRLAPIDQHEKRKAADPGPIGFPFEPMELFRQLFRREDVFALVVKPPAMDCPLLAAHEGVFVRRRVKLVVQGNEIEGRPDPGDARDQVQPAYGQIDPFGKGGEIHLLSQAKGLCCSATMRRKMRLRQGQSRAGRIYP